MKNPNSRVQLPYSHGSSWNGVAYPKWNSRHSYSLGYIYLMINTFWSLISFPIYTNRRNPVTHWGNVKNPVWKSLSPKIAGCKLRWGIMNAKWVGIGWMKRKACEARISAAAVLNIRRGTPSEVWGSLQLKGVRSYVMLNTYPVSDPPTISSGGCLGHSIAEAGLIGLIWRNIHL